MAFGRVAEKRKAAAVAHRDSQTGVDEAFPEIRVVKDMPDAAFCICQGDIPVPANALSGLFGAVGQRPARSTNELAVARHYDGRVGGLPAELVDHVSRLTPVGVDEAALDTHGGAVRADPGAIEQTPCQRFQAT